MTDRAVYLYCLAEAEPIAGFQGFGLDGDQPVAAILVEGVAAVVSRVRRNLLPLGDGDLTEDERSRVVALAIRHGEVVEDVFRLSPVLPVRFGTLFRDEDTVGGLLTTCAGPVRRFLEAARGRAEWVVKGFLQQDRARRSVIAAEPELAARFNELPVAPGLRYLQERRLFAEADRRTSRWVAAMANQVSTVLSDPTIPVRPLRVSARPDPGLGGPQAYHAAFLVPHEDRGGWLRRLDAATAEFEPRGLKLIGTGPWPPSDFAPDLSRMLQQ